jgi:hypothetical protein
MRFRLFLGFILLLLSASWAFASESGVRSAWLAYAKPAISPQDYPTAFHLRQARQTAISILQASPDQKDSELQEALGYFLLRDYQYHKAQIAFEAALKHRGNEPRLRYFLAVTKAILLTSNPDTMPEQSKTVIEEFQKAAKAESQNALPLLQAASVAFDSDRPDLAVPLVTEALAKPGFYLYRLPVPSDLVPDGPQATAAWWLVESELWGEIINRATNCARGLMREGNRLSLRKETAAAQELYQKAEAIGQMLTRTAPPLASSLAAGLEVERQALVARSEAPGARQQLAKVEAAQEALQKSWEDLQVQEKTNPPKTPEARLENQKQLVEKILAQL